MNELIDILDDKGNKIGEELKSVAHQRGLWHKSVHVLINNINSDMSLFQKRCSLKDLYPNKWDIAVGGHVGAKEEEINAAIRELKEELGITVNIDELKLINVVKENLLDNNIISNEFVYIYLLQKDIDVESIRLQKEEVSDIRWLSKTEINNYVNNNMVVPHKEDFKIINELLH